HDVEKINDYIVSYLAKNSVFVKEVYVCPHRRSDACSCIKPKPFFFQQAAAKFDLDLTASVAVGDHPHDIDTTQNLLGSGVYLLSGHGRKHFHELRAGTLAAPTLREAVDWIFALKQYDNKVLKLQEALHKAGEAIKNGKLAAFPTETVYGLGANAFNTQAVARVFEVKRRPANDPLIVHIADISQAERLVEHFGEKAQKLAERFWPGPLTLVLKKSPNVPDMVTSGFPNIAIRMPDNQLALELIRISGVPVAAPSANPFGYISPTSAEHVRQQLGKEVGIILDGGQCRVGVESTIISFVNTLPEVLRYGGIPIEEIEKLIGPVIRKNTNQAKQLYPGQFPRHYSPHTPVILLKPGENPPEGKSIGLLGFGSSKETAQFTSIEMLSSTGDLDEAAVNLYGALHRLDALNLDVIVARLVPDEGLGTAINDRLRKAANQSIQIPETEKRQTE
ncbi:MAG TPA: L-threonylcarbamoyladenylate synthase, partial [Dehalococcoidales bacterium]|nr:L-threonylcarbamoyladenylate synthase [Dehalococcoidales bacterium]